MVRTLAGVAIGLVALPAQVAAGNLDAGAEIAMRWCSSCHLVTVDGEGSDAAPPFAMLAQDPDLSDGSMRAWIMDPHQGMPRLDLTDMQIEDVVAYIRSLE